MSLQPLDKKALSRSIIGESAPTLAEITIRKSQPFVPRAYNQLTAIEKTGAVKFRRRVPLVPHHKLKRTKPLDTAHRLD